MDRTRLMVVIGLVVFLLMGLAAYFLFGAQTASGVAAEANNDSFPFPIIIVILIAVFLPIFAARQGEKEKRKPKNQEDIYTVNDLDEVVLGDDGELIYPETKNKHDDLL